MLLVTSDDLSEGNTDSLESGATNDDEHDSEGQVRLPSLAAYLGISY